METALRNDVSLSEEQLSNDAAATQNRRRNSAEHVTEQIGTLYQDGGISPLQNAANLEDENGDEFLTRHRRRPSSGSSIPLESIEYNASPAAMAQERSNLQALRRMSLNLSVSNDPDLPLSFDIPAGPPTSDSAEDDAARLFWVPARLHPEVAPLEWQTFIEKKVKSQRGLKITTGGQNLSSASVTGQLGRRRSMLVHQIDTTNGHLADEYVDGSSKLQRRSSSDQAKPFTVADLEKLDVAVKGNQNLPLSPLGSPAQSTEPVEPIGDTPIVVPKAGAGGSLRRASHTYRKGSMRMNDRLRSQHLNGAQESPSTDGSPLPSELAPSPTLETSPLKITSTSLTPTEPHLTSLSDSEPKHFDPEPHETMDHISSSWDRIFSSPTENLANTLQTKSGTAVSASKNESNGPSTPPKRPTLLSQRHLSDKVDWHSNNETVALKEKQNLEKSTLNISKVKSTSVDSNGDTKSKKGAWGRIFQNEAKATKSSKEKKSESLRRSRSQDQHTTVRPMNTADDTRLDLVQRSIESINEETASEPFRRPLSAGSIDKVEEKKDPGLFSSLFSRKKEAKRSLENKRLSLEHETQTSVEMNSKNVDTEEAAEPADSTSTVFVAPSPFFYARFPLHIERAIYRLSHLKLANPRRPLHQQVLLSNFMYYYLDLINQLRTIAPINTLEVGQPQDFGGTRQESSSGMEDYSGVQVNGLF